MNYCPFPHCERMVYFFYKICLDVMAVFMESHLLTFRVFPCPIQVDWHMKPFISAGKTWHWCLIKALEENSREEATASLRWADFSCHISVRWCTCSHLCLSQWGTLFIRWWQSMPIMSCFNMFLFPLVCYCTFQLLGTVDWACVKSSIVVQKV